MDQVERKRLEQPRRPTVHEVAWTAEAIEAALNCMWSPKTTKGQKSYRQNMKLALNAAWKEQFKDD